MPVLLVFIFYRNGVYVCSELYLRFSNTYLSPPIWLYKPRSSRLHKGIKVAWWSFVHAWRNNSTTNIKVADYQSFWSFFFASMVYIFVESCILEFLIRLCCLFQIPLKADICPFAQRKKIRLAIICALVKKHLKQKYKSF